MRNLSSKESIMVSGGKCQYDYNTEEALRILTNNAAANGSYGTEAYERARAQIIANATYSNCKL